ncbi:hypothetical protein B0H14DRAFT_2852650, partial [Mycena olivaceomarginata]
MIPSVDHHHHGGPTACPTPALRSDAQPCPHNELTTHRQHLESLLDSALATLMLIQAASASVPVFGTHIPVLHPLPSPTTTAATMTSAPTPAPISTTATYAAATYAAAAASNPRPSGPSLGPAMPERAASPSRPSAPAPCLGPLKADPLALYKAISGALINGFHNTRLVVGVQWSRKGNLILHPAVNACTASYLTEQSPFIWPAIRPLLKLPEEYDCPAFETDEHWHLVVFHAAPAPPDDRTYTRSLIEDGLAASDIPNRVFKGYSVLSRPADIQTRGSLALRVSLLSEPDALRLINKGGFMAGTWCKVTPYLTKPSSALQADLRANPPAT